MRPAVCLPCMVQRMCLPTESAQCRLGLGLEALHSRSSVRIFDVMTHISTLDLDERQRLAGLLDEQSASDAAAEYYALHHPVDKTRLFAVGPTQGQPKGFLAVARTGLDLFRPLLLPFVGQADALRALLSQIVPEIGTGILRIPTQQLGWLDNIVSMDECTKFEILRLAPDQFEPTLNVLVVESPTPDGNPRYEVRTADGEFAAAGLNWIGPRFAEVYLQSTDGARRRRLTRSVLSAMLGRMLGQRRHPLYMVREGDPVARTEAFQLGFRPTGLTVALAEIHAQDESPLG